MVTTGEVLLYTLPPNVMLAITPSDSAQGAANYYDDKRWDRAFSDGRELRDTDVQKLHFDQGIAVTAHAAQGKTVDQVLVAAFSQVNQTQLYVSMSRARHAIHLFTDSKAALGEAVTKTNERPSAISLLSRAVSKAFGLDHARWKAFHQAQRVDMARGMER